MPKPLLLRVVVPLALPILDPSPEAQKPDTNDPLQGHPELLQATI